MFYGTFTATATLVDGMYINTTSDYQACSDLLTAERFKNLTVDNSYIKGGSFCRRNSRYINIGTVKNCVNDAYVIGDAMGRRFARMMGFGSTVKSA
jgi:flavin-dependent dehydrogenase